MTDFFVSYTKTDEQWAEWIGWILEDAGFSVTLQAWDFAAGGNFVIEMQRAAGEASRTIAILSPDYLDSRYAAPEWAAAFAADPEGLRRQLVPVRVSECRLEGLWKAIIHIDLVGLNEPRAQQRLLTQIAGKRGKPIVRPAFPGAAGAQRPQFPGGDRQPAAAASKPYIPTMRGAHSDLDKRRFLREAFPIVARHFERGLAALSETHGSIDVDFNSEGSSKFTADIFVNGKSQARCKVWIANQFGEGIAYYEGMTSLTDNTLNEILVVGDEEDKLVLSAQMSGIAFGRVGEGLDLRHLSPEEGAEYLWRRFVQRLE